MDERDNVPAGSMTGDQCEAALTSFRTQLADWGLVMPPVEPLVMDFGLGDFYRTGLIEYWIANEIRAGYCGKFLFVFDGQTCPQHRHDEKHETFFVVKGAVDMVCRERSITLRAGDVLPVPPGQFHRFTGKGPALLLEVSMPCRIDDNEFIDARIPYGKHAAIARPDSN